VFQARRKLAWGACIAVGIALVWAFIRVVSGYDMVADYLTRGVGHSWDWGSKIGIAGFERPYFVWIFLNLVEYASFVGVPLAIAATWHGVSTWRQLTPAAALVTTILLLDLTGVNRSEVARVWMFLSPMMAVAASRLPPWMVGVVWVQALLFKLTLSTGNIFS
jgi:hypothetical protein